MTDTYFEPLIDAWDGDATPIEVVDAEDVAARTAADARLAALAKTADFSGKSGQVLLIPGVDGALERVLFAPGGKAMAWRGLPARLPGGVYRLESPDEAAATAFALGSYRFDRYKSKAGQRPRLLVQGIDTASARRTARACALARDMVFGGLEHRVRDLLGRGRRIEPARMAREIAATLLGGFGARPAPAADGAPLDRIEARLARLEGELRARAR